MICFLSFWRASSLFELYICKLPPSSKEFFVQEFLKNVLYREPSFTKRSSGQHLILCIYVTTYTFDHHCILDVKIQIVRLELISLKFSSRSSNIKNFEANRYRKWIQRDRNHYLDIIVCYKLFVLICFQLIYTLRFNSNSHYQFDCIKA